MSLFMNFTGETYELTSLGYGVLIAFFVLALIAACFFTGKDEKRHFSVKQLVFAAMCGTCNGHIHDKGMEDAYGRFYYIILNVFHNICWIFVWG